MKTRIIAGLAAAAVVLWLMFWGNFSLILSVVLFSSIVGYLEFDRLFFTVRSLSRQVCMSSLVILTELALHHDLTLSIFFIFLSFTFIGVTNVFTSSKVSDFKPAVQSLSLQWLGYLYV